MSDMQVSNGALAHAAVMVDRIVRTAHPGTTGERRTLLVIAAAIAEYDRHAQANDPGFGREAEVTRAYLQIATDLAVGFRRSTNAPAASAIDTRTAG